MQKVGRLMNLVRSLLPVTGVTDLPRSPEHVQHIEELAMSPFFLTVTMIEQQAIRNGFVLSSGTAYAKSCIPFAVNDGGIGEVSSTLVFDIKKSISKDYEVFYDNSIARRATFVIDDETSRELSVATSVLIRRGLKRIESKQLL
uniref:Uncharacterized protein n=1 Tax=Onchocerca volvulus TaxID=6282 RepID=A0A8R1TMY4_ONCVO